MKDKGKKPLRIALHGMDARSHKTMVMFLQGPCKGVAAVVDSIEAEIDIIDADFPTAKSIFEELRQNWPGRPLIAMSLEDLRLDDSIYLKKPVSREGLLQALQQAKALLVQTKVKPSRTSSPLNQQLIKELSSPAVQSDSMEAVQNNHQQYPSKVINETERKKTAKHQSSVQFNEGGFSSFIGLMPEIDANNKDQVLRSSYNPKQYYQGYVKSAFNVATAKARVVQLNSGWKPLLIFPHSNEIWLDAEDKQLRAFAGLPVSNATSSSLSLAPVDMNSIRVDADLEKFQTMEAFLWKLAIWTSKGRYPSSLDTEQPIYLKKWPNMTRLTVTPHALRICALLIREPRSMLNIAEALNIKLQYVFVFVSACQALDLIGQARRESDQIIAPEEIKATESGNLFRKILNKLRA